MELLKNTSKELFPSLFAVLLALLPINAAHAQIFVANADDHGSGEGTIGVYNSEGSPANASLVSGLINPWGLAVSGSDLFVSNSFNGTIGEYTTSAAKVNASLVRGLMGVAAWTDGPAGFLASP